VPDGLAYLIGVWTGLRRGELLQLRWSDIDLEHGILRLRAEATKSRRADVIPIHPELRAALCDARPLNVTDSMFVVDTVPSSRCVIADLKFAQIPQVIERNGRKEYIDFHALRLTLNSLLAGSRSTSGLPRRCCATAIRG